MEENIISGLLTIVALLIGLSGSIASAWNKRRGRKGAGPVAAGSGRPAQEMQDDRRSVSRARTAKSRAVTPVGAAGKGAAAPEVSVTPEAERPAGERFAEEFDLRRAVIYSEILNPKFKEENF